MKRILPVTVVLLLALAGCGSDDKPTAKPSPSPSATGLLYCLAAGEGTRVEVRSDSGYQVPVVMLGTGTRAVVFSNTADGRPCDWIDTARELAGKGYRVAFWDYRHVDLDALKDLTAVVAAVRQQGATKIVLAGGSRGGCLSMIGGVEIAPPVSGVAVLSCARKYNRDNPVEMAPYVARARLPVLYLTGENDGLPTLAEVQADIAAVPSADKKLVVVPGTSAHGDDLLSDPAAAAVAKPAFMSFVDRVTA